MRRRILLSIVAVAATAVALFGAALAVSVGQLYRTEEMARLQREATAAAGVVPASGLRGEDPVELPRHRRGTRLALYDVRGSLVTGSGPSDGGTAVRRALGGEVASGVEGRALAVAVPVRSDELVVGAARASLPVAAVAARTRRTWFAMLGLGLLVLLVAAAIAERQAGRLARPVADLARTAERLGHGDLAARAGRHGVPELDAASAALDATAERLGRLLERERAFAADASHQLSTPLTGLRVTLESALVTPGADLHRAVEDAVGEVDRLQATVSELLALARDAPRPAEPLDLSALGDEVWQRWHQVLVAQARPLRLDIEPELPAVRASEAAVRQIVAVLVENAVRHGAGTVTVSARRVGDGVALEVADEGDGVAGDPEAVFARRFPGSSGHGIGLSLARSLAEVEGGRLFLRRAGPRPEFALVLTVKQAAG